MAELGNVPKEIAAKIYADMAPEAPKGMAGIGQRLLQHHMKTHIGKIDVSDKIGSPPKALIPAVDYIRAYWKAQGGAYDDMSNLPTTAGGAEFDKTKVAAFKAGL